MAPKCIAFLSLLGLEWKRGREMNIVFLMEKDGKEIHIIHFNKKGRETISIIMFYHHGLVAFRMKKEKRKGNKKHIFFKVFAFEF